MSDAAAEALELLQGEKISHGSTREVFVCAIDPAWVVKVEDPGQFQNATEWSIWQEVKDTPQAKWFAPCLHISPGGRVLIQMRTTPAEPSRYPRRIPAFFDDTKRANFGLLDGRIVCHDFGVNLLIKRGLTARLVAARWWDE